jgi:hypothetical protein
MPTYPAIAGIGKARERVRELHEGAAGLLAENGWRGRALGKLADWMLSRSH